MKASFPSLRQLLLTTFLALYIFSFISFAQGSASDAPKADEATPQDDQSIVVPMKTIETALHEVYSKKFEDLPQYTYLRNEVSEESEDHYVTTLYLSKGRATPIKVVANLELSYAECTTWDLKKASKWIVQTTRFIRETDKEFAKDSPSEQRRLELIAKLTSGEFLDMTVNEPRLVTGELTCGPFQPLTATETKEPNEPKPEMGENEANRSDKMGAIYLEVIGFTALPVGGLRGSYFINKDLMLEVGFATGTAKISDWEYQKTIVSAKAKYFVSDTFYVDGGIGHESWDVDYPVLTGDASSERKTLNGSATNLGVEFHIGNQWQWQNFTLGCDWIGYFLSLSTSESYSNDESVNIEDKKSEEDDIASNVTGGSLHFLRFYLGYAF